VNKSLHFTVGPLFCLFFLFIAIPCSHALSDREDLSWVQSWAVWLQDANVQTLVDSTYDLVVIDYSRDGTDDTAFTFEEIQAIRASGKLVLAYFSIGEAEDYRFYWQPHWKTGSPSFIGEENPDWPGNYKVLYWQAGWWDQALAPYLERILSAGFDGVYLDIIDAYYYWGLEGYDFTKSARRMIDLVSKIAAHARARFGEHFIVCPQNGLGIFDDAPARKVTEYLQTMDAMGVESLIYNIWSREDQAYRIEKLKEISAAGKLIFDLEYIGPLQWDEYYTLLGCLKGILVGYAADPDFALDELTYF
jgi:cysteinyl-tRNA synthetase